jgi:hypothetical protein
MEGKKSTNRNQQFSTRVKKTQLAQLKKITYEEDIKYVEVLKKPSDFYEQN